MRTVILLGELGKRYGRRHLLDVKSPAEAVRALCANFKDFASFVSSSHERNVAYRVINVRDDVGIDELHNPSGQRITITPVIIGANFISNAWKSTVGKVLLGTAIVAAAFLTGGASIAASGFLAGGITTTFWGGVALSVGVSLALGGVAQMLAPQPKSSGPQEEQQPSYVFNGAVNTTAQGQPVPVGYGRMIVGSAVISAGISVEDIAA